MAKSLLGCSDIVKAINLQFELAGRGLKSTIIPALHGYAVQVHPKDTVTSPVWHPMRSCRDQMAVTASRNKSWST